MSISDITPNKAPLLTPEQAAGLQGHAWPEAPFHWAQQPVKANPFWSKGRIWCAAIVAPWLLVGLLLRFVFHS